MSKHQPIDTKAIHAVIGKYAEQNKSVAERSKIYEELVGYVPGRIQARLHVTGALDPTMLDMQEDIRKHAMYPACFDTKTSQLMLFAVLLMGLNEAAPVHAGAARRAGATYEELQAVVNMVFLYRGLPAANGGAEILKTLAESEHNASASS